MIRAFLMAAAVSMVLAGTAWAGSESQKDQQGLRAVAGLTALVPLSDGELSKIEGQGLVDVTVNAHLNNVRVCNNRCLTGNITINPL